MIQIFKSSKRSAVRVVNIQNKLNKALFTTDVLHSVPSLIQSYVSGLQYMTAMPWWATIATSTIVVRIALLPIVRYQYIHVAKLAGYSCRSTCY